MNALDEALRDVQHAIAAYQSDAHAIRTGTMEAGGSVELQTSYDDITLVVTRMQRALSLIEPRLDTWGR